MKSMGAARIAVLAGTAAFLSGCYTVVLAPYTPAAAPVEERYEADTRPDDDYLSPQVGRFRDRDGYDGYGAYGAYGASPYDYGFPVYDSRYGLASFGPSYSPYYGYGGYYAGSGPYGYGYDPYYYGSGGGYAPPGYELVTTTELQQLLDDRRLLNTGSPTGPTQAELQRQQQERERRAETAWSRRVDARERKEPQPTVRTAPAATGSSTTTTTTATAAGSASGSSTSKPAATQSSGSTTAKDRKKRR